MLDRIDMLMEKIEPAINDWIDNHPIIFCFLLAICCSIGY